MTHQVINVGAAPNDGMGTNLRDAWELINSNFDSLYSIAIPLTSLADVQDNGVTVGNVITLNQGAFFLGDVNLGTYNLVANGATTIYGANATSSRLTSSSANPTLTFINGGFSASGLIGAAGIRINNTGGGAAVRIEGTSTIAFITNGLTSAAGNAVELHNVGGVGITNYTVIGATNGLVMTGTTNSGPVIRSFNPISLSGKGIDIQGNITSGALRISDALIQNVIGNAVEVSGSIQGMDFSGDAISTTGNGMRISGTVAGVALLSKANILSLGSDGCDITGSTISNFIVTTTGMTSTAANKSGLKGDASSANITTAAIFEATNIAGLGAGGTALSGITKKDLKYSFTKAGATIVDSRNIGSLTLDAQATTTISNRGATATVTAFADAGSGNVTVSSTLSYMANGAPVVILGSVNYDGVYTMASVNAGVSFTIIKAYVAETPSGVTCEGGWFKISGATTAGSTIERFDMPASNRLRSLDSKTLPVTYSCTISGEKSGATVKAYQFGLFRDNGSGLRRINGTVSGDFTDRASSLTFRVPTEIASNGYFELYVRNLDGTESFIADNLTVDIGIS
jgi:hypothetical protein